jgi:MoaA/NifB/PqqE/SkfB family radical SAM enzyme
MIIRHSKYWDNFEQRIFETVKCLKNNQPIPISRVAVFITKKCNFRCAYCNMKFQNSYMKLKTFDDICSRHSDAILHITGGEPSTVNYLYHFIETHKGNFHLNTNAFIRPPKNIKRMKISFDTCDEIYFNNLVNKKYAFNNVCNNIKYSITNSITSLTSVLTKENYKNAPKLMNFCLNNFPGLYAVFFSVYKGTNKRFCFDKQDCDIFFNEIKPKLENEMNEESLNLFNETIDEKFRIMEGKRFPENQSNSPCYLSMSERIYNIDGNFSNCSHLFRDGILQIDNIKRDKCLYGCNRRLVEFNMQCEKLLK